MPVEGEILELNAFPVVPAVEEREAEAVGLKVLAPASR